MHTILRFTEQISLFQNTEFIDLLCNLGQERIKAMDEAGFVSQVLSFSSPGIDEFAPDHLHRGFLSGRTQ